MKYTADCPSCDHEFDVNSEMAARAGLVCPKCSTGFVPEKIHRIQPTEEELVEQQLADERRREYNLQVELEVDATNCFGIGLALIIGCVILVFVAFANEMSPAALAAAGGSLSLAFIFFFFSQCLRIRAALQKLYRKE